MEEFERLVESLKQHLFDVNRQNWLLGAGISYDAKIPLMYPLTDRVKIIIESGDSQRDKDILAALGGDLDENSHIEHYLSHLGDLIAIAERSKARSARLGENGYEYEELINVHRSIVAAIGETIRYGYQNEETIGTAENPIVEIDHHLKFIEALFSNRAELERRSKITFFTTNYDTLLEDALALHKKEVVDGFSGGSMGFWNPSKEFSKQIDDSNLHFLYKLHGSIDWLRDDVNQVVRARYGTKYLSDPANIMIYPQATKYVETQKDPFASLFAGLRSALSELSQNVLITSGYSFGDDHINAEIEACLNRNGNKTSVIAFIEERPQDGIVINSVLDKWLVHPVIGKRVFVAGKNGLYNNSTTPNTPTDKTGDFDWCWFAGLTRFLKTGAIE